MMDYPCKLNKKSFEKFFILSVLLILFSCNNLDSKDSEVSSISNKDEDIRTVTPSDLICFNGSANDSDLCFFAILKEDVLRESNSYTYGNPYTDQSFPSRWDPTFYEMPMRFVDLDRENPDASIADNFKLKEVMQARKGRFGHFSPFVTRVLQDMRTQTNHSIRVNSAYRSPAYNAGTSGSSKWSRHQYGDAVDLYISGLSIKEMGDLCADFKADFVLRYKTHIHCDWRWTAKLEDNLSFIKVNALKVKSLTIKHIDNLSQATKIIIQKDSLYEGGSVTLSIHSDHGEDHGELLNDWEVLTPGGEKIIQSSSKFELENLETGTYQIKALAGGLINVSRSFNVK